MPRIQRFLKQLLVRGKDPPESKTGAGVGLAKGTGGDAVRVEVYDAGSAGGGVEGAGVDFVAEDGELDGALLADDVDDLAELGGGDVLSGGVVRVANNKQLCLFVQEGLKLLKVQSPIILGRLLPKPDGEPEGLGDRVELLIDGIHANNLSLLLPRLRIQQKTEKYQKVPGYCTLGNQRILRRPPLLPSSIPLRN